MKRATPRVDAALEFTIQGLTQEVRDHPEKWLVNVARDIEREHGDLWDAIGELFTGEQIRRLTVYIHEGKRT